MIYPDEEKVTYGYNLGGQVDHVRGYKSYGYDYVNKIGYDKFEQRTYLKYCNGAETFYSYDPARRRLQNLVVNAKAGTIMDNAYSYDAVSNVLGVKNNAPLPQSGKAGGQMSHSYTYDPLYRLASATGTYKGTDNKSASYTLSMGYDNMHRITSKKQHLSQTGVQFEGTLNAGYELAYIYGSAEGKKFQLDNVRDINYRTEETPTDSTNINNRHKYTYDLNGNLVYINTSRVKKDGKEDKKASEQKYRWDEENRLLAADENGFVSNYWYDADGERTVKTSGENEAIYVNSEFSGGNTGTARFSLYVSPYLVAGQGGKYTKHIYIGSQRIVSKLGDLASYGADPRRIPYAGNEADGLTINYKDKYNQQLQSIKDNYKTFDIPYNGKDNDDYVNGQGFCCNDATPEAEQARAMARTRAVNGNFKPNDDYEKMQFYYHPDHLGSSSYITNLDGEVSQHIEYVPFGEVFIEERNNTWNTPYFFNAKEFDEKTGMYYYGARYYEPRLSLWMSVDPLAEKYVFWGVYTYCYDSPLNHIDVEGLFPIGFVTQYTREVTRTQAVGMSNTVVSYTVQETYFKFTESAAYALSLVSGVPVEYIKNAELVEWRNQPSGNCITFGSSPNNVRILVSPYYINDDEGGQDYNLWLREFSHEVSHIKQIARDKDVGVYLLKSIWGYIKTFSHDNAPREIEAEQGTNVFNQFNRFVKTKHRTSVEALLKSKKAETDKIKMLKEWWKEFSE